MHGDHIAVMGTYLSGWTLFPSLPTDAHVPLIKAAKHSLQEAGHCTWMLTFLHRRLGTAGGCSHPSNNAMATKHSLHKRLGTPIQAHGRQATVQIFFLRYGFYTGKRKRNEERGSEKLEERKGLGLGAQPLVAQTHPLVMMRGSQWHAQSSAAVRTRHCQGRH